MGIKETMMTIGIAIGFSGCVTTHSGERTKIANEALVVSCAENSAYRTKLNTAITCNFENVSDTWQAVKLTTARFSDVSRLLTAQESKDFIVAFSEKRALENHNASLALGLIALGGLVAMSSSHQSVHQLGTVTAVGAVGAEAGREISSEYSKNQYGVPEYGEEHILGGGFNVPASLFVRKSFLVQLSDVNPSTSQLELCFEKPEAECVALPIAWEQKVENTRHSNK